MLYYFENVCWIRNNYHKDRIQKFHPTKLKKIIKYFTFIRKNFFAFCIIKFSIIIVIFNDNFDLFKIFWCQSLDNKSFSCYKSSSSPIFKNAPSLQFQTIYPVIHESGHSEIPKTIMAQLTCNFRISLPLSSRARNYFAI